MCFSSSEIMPTPCFCLPLPRGCSGCCGEKTVFLLMSVLEDFQKIRQATLRAVGTPSVQGPWVSRHQGLEAGAWAGVERVLPWSGPADSILPWCLQLPTAVGATTHHGGTGLLQHRCGAATPWTHKAWKDIKRAYASAMALSSSQLSCLLRAICAPSPPGPSGKELYSEWGGLGTKCSVLSWHTARLSLTASVSAPGGLWQQRRGMQQHKSERVSGGGDDVLRALESARRKGAGVMRSEKWLAHKEGLN